MTNGQVLSLATYPIKGFNSEMKDEIELVKGDGFPGDRMFGFAKKSSGFDAKNPKPLPKDRFIVLLQYANLARLKTIYDPNTRLLSIKTKNDGTSIYNMADEIDKNKVSVFLSDFLNLTENEKPYFVGAGPSHRFTDVSVVSKKFMNAISLLNLDSVKKLGMKISKKIDPLRFRANIIFEGWPAFSELELVDRVIKIGEVEFRVLQRTKRCAATEVNPKTAKRDLKIPNLLKKNFNHSDMGIYLETLNDGILKKGQAVELLEN